MKTAEEILDKYTLWQGEKAVRTEENMLLAMEEYAEQELKKCNLPLVVGRSAQLKADLYNFRNMFCQNVDISTIDEYIENLGF